MMDSDAHVNSCALSPLNKINVDITQTYWPIISVNWYIGQALIQTSVGGQPEIMALWHWVQVLSWLS